MIKRKDIVTPDPLWNETSPRRLKLPKRCPVLDVVFAQSQTGVLLVVQTLTGDRLELDSGWFFEGRRKTKKPKPLEQTELFGETQSELNI